LGPFVSVGKECQVKNSILRNSILEAGATLSDTGLEDSLIGQKASISGRLMRLNTGDHTQINI
jgi:glucose-1-phosphate thymidylyltransferase